jgi:hypothetical protein
MEILVTSDNAGTCEAGLRSADQADLALWASVLDIHHNPAIVEVANRAHPEFPGNECLARERESAHD